MVWSGTRALLGFSVLILFPSRIPCSQTVHHKLPGSMNQVRLAGFEKQWLQRTSFWAVTSLFKGYLAQPSEWLKVPLYLAVPGIQLWAPLRNSDSERKAGGSISLSSAEASYVLVLRISGCERINNWLNLSSLNCFLPIFAGDVGKTSDDISLTLVESCSHDHGKHAWYSHTNKNLSHVTSCDISTPSFMFIFFGPI